MRRCGMTANEANVHHIPTTVGHLKAFNNEQNQLHSQMGPTMTNVKQFK